MYVEVTKDKLFEVASKAINLEKLQTFVYAIVDIIMEKNAAYGDAWQKFAIFVPLIRIREKIVRLENLASHRPHLAYDENIDEELDDIIAYALLAKLWLSDNFEVEMEEIVKKLQEEYTGVDVETYQHFDFTIKDINDEQAEFLMDDILDTLGNKMGYDVASVFGGGVHPITDADIPDEEVGDE